MPEHPEHPQRPSRDGYATPTGCLNCGAVLPGRADQRYCGHPCRQAAHRRRTNPPIEPAAALPAAGTRRAHTIYECDTCGQRLAGQQWCPDCQRPCRRLGTGGSCPSCGDPILITDLIEAPMP